MRQFARILALSLLTTVLPTAATAATVAPKDPSIVGHWVMHLYIGTRVFEDEVTVKVGPDGKLGGTLVVPDRFTVPLDKVELKGETFVLEITADEGQGPFRVRYEGTFHPTGDTFVGFATVLGENSLLGGFVGQRR